MRVLTLCLTAASTTLHLHANAAPPPWAQGTIWYQILPERFANGSPTNDPRGLHATPMPWTRPWHEVDESEIERLWACETARHARSSPRRPIFQRVVYRRRYGGDLQGVLEHLPSIRSLGIEVIYLTPIFASSSLHKYDARDHRHIDPTLACGEELPEDPLPPEQWSWTPSDRWFVDEFLPRAHEAGLRVVIDGVWNHVGLDHFAFRDVLIRGRDSPYADWFKVRFDDQGRVTGWTAWDGINGRLPEFRQTPGGDLVPQVKKYVFDVTRRWMDPDADGDPSDGVDGWRLDVVPEIGTAFWRDWLALVHAINPNAVTVCEVWDPAHDLLADDLFDAQMNYPFARAVIHWLRGDRDSAWLADRLSRLLTLPEPTLHAQMNLLTSHDTERLATMLEHPARPYDPDTDPLSNDASRAHTAGDRTRRLAEIAVAIQATWIGSPMIYAGDEILMHGADDPHNRQPFPWHLLADDAPTPQTPREHLETVRDWMALRHDAVLGPILRRGAVEILPSKNPDLFAFVRTLNGQSLTVICNRGPRPEDAGNLGFPDTIVPPHAVVLIRP